MSKEIRSYLDLQGTDFDLYDDQPTDNPDDYVQGYCTICYVTMRERLQTHLQKCIEVSNAYAYIPTEYKSAPDVPAPYVVSYVIHKNPWDRLIFYHKYTKTIDKHLTLCQATIHGGLEEQIWFHKAWILPQYHELTFKTPGHKYMHYINSLQKYITKETAVKLRMECMIEYGCYTPTGDGYYCKGGIRNWQICARCCLSHFYDRYFRGKCIDKLPPEEKNKNRKGLRYKKKSDKL